MRLSVPLEGGDPNQEQERLAILNSIIKKIDNESQDLHVECKAEPTHMACVFDRSQVRDCEENEEVLGFSPKSMPQCNPPSPPHCNPPSM
jgi:hypothetical protein